MRTTIIFGLILVGSLVASAGSLKTAVPFYDHQQNHLATVTLSLETQKTDSCIQLLSVLPLQTYGRTSPMGRVVAEPRISQLNIGESGSRFSLETRLFWEFDSSPGLKDLGIQRTQCAFSCEGVLSCR